MNVIGHRLLIVTAHPDDESFLAAGTMWKNSEAHGKNYVFCATLGERGKAHFKKPVTKTALKRIRKRELMLVSKKLGVARVKIGNLPDGEVSQSKYKIIFRKKLLAYIESVKPDLILGFGRDGISGHRDHIAAGEIAEKASKKFRIPYLAFCMSPMLQKYQHHLQNRRKHGVYKNTPPLETPDIVIRIDKEHKLNTLCLHKSQHDNGNPFWGLPKSVANAHLRAEYFAVRT